MIIKILKYKHKCFFMSEEFAFYTPAELVEARQQAVTTNKERIQREFADMFNKTAQYVRNEINEKLMTATTSTWEQSDATMCCLKFGANDLTFKLLTEEHKETIVSYYTYNNHLNLDERLYDNYDSTSSDRDTNINYFKCDLIIPMAYKLAEIGYGVEWDLFPDAWGFSVNWKLT